MKKIHVTVMCLPGRPNSDLKNMRPTTDPRVILKMIAEFMVLVLIFFCMLLLFVLASTVPEPTNY
jgi:hypothetical protein